MRGLAVDGFGIGGGDVSRKGGIHALRVLTICTCFAGSAWPQQQMSSYERGRALDMLQTVSNDVKKHYYDPKFHGVNLEGRVAEAKQGIEKAQ